MTGAGPCDALRPERELPALELVGVELVGVELVGVELVGVEPWLCPTLPPPPGAAAPPTPFWAVAAGARVARTSTTAMARRATEGRLGGLIEAS
ncbi:MAG: hypothetical protein ABR946_08305 [Solirubrobacteraceae bacterium]|jgi:hypothetical protein